MFIEPDEHLIVMEDDLVVPMSLDDFYRIEEAGVKTVLIPHAIQWYKMTGKNWADSMDASIEKALHTKMKIILPFFYSAPPYITLNYASEEFGKTVDEFALRILDHYSSIKDRIQLTFAIPDGGEFFFDSVQRSNFPFSDETLIKFIIDRQKILVQQHNEVWLHLHNYLGDKYNWNNVHLPIVYKAVRETFPDATFYSIQFAHFACGNTPTGVDVQMKCKQYLEEFGIKFFVGSEYCEGLDTNYKHIKEQGLWGFVTCPMHSLNPVQHTSIEPWMVEALRSAIHRFEELQSGSNQI